MRSRICFSVRFSPPRMYRSPGVPRSSATTCIRATSVTSTRFRPGVHVGGKFFVQEVDDDPAGWRGLGIARADRRRGIENHDMLAGLRGFDCLLLAEKLRSFVVADHVRQRNGSLLVHDGSVGLEAHRRDAGGVDDALDANLTRQLQQLACAIDVGGIHLFRIAHPQPVVGRYMNQSIAASQAQIAASPARGDRPSPSPRQCPQANPAGSSAWSANGGWRPPQHIAEPHGRRRSPSLP